MRVILVNGSPHKEGSTYTALTEVAMTLGKHGIEAEIFWLGNKAISGCIGCGSCHETKRCFIDDKVNEFLELSEQADGFIFGSPVHFASASGMLSSFMDRVFYSNMSSFRGKPASAVVTCRRGGSSAALDRINKYFSISNMPIVSSQYWNMVHGSTPDQVKQDLEGMQIMRTLGHNMAWMLHCIEAGKKAGINFPVREEERARTDFIR